MNYALAREVYGGLPWMVDRLSFSTLSSMLKDFRNGVPFSAIGESKLNSMSFYGVMTGTRYISSDLKKPAEAQNEQLISITKINGPITKNGGRSSYGMQELAQSMLAADADPKVIGHVIVADSGGGSSAGMEIMQHAIDSLTKTNATVIERGGVAASAMYGIAAHTKRIFAESKSVTVGSIGSMISFSAQPNKTINAAGEKQVTIYATPSTKKNLWFEEALNNDNYELALSEILNPHVEQFRADMRAQRKNILESQLDGSTYDAGNVIGTLVDEIGGINEAINFVKSESKSNFNNNSNLNNMTPQEIKSQFPEAHAAIFSAGRAEGVTAGAEAEQERVKSWQVYAAVDQEAVNKGIASGKEISNSEMHAFLLKSTSANALKGIQTDSAKNVVTEESKGAEAEKTADQKEFDALYGKYKATLPNAN